MPDDGGGNVVLVNVAKIVLLLVNMAFMVAGSLLVYFSHRVKTSGWLDAFQGDYAWVGTSTFLFTLILGAVVMTLAALGCFGALLRQKLLLTIYAVVLVITAGFFVVVAIGAHSANSKATDWGAADFPAVESETSIGENFNQLYCAAQVPYYCVDAGINDVLTVFGQSLPGYFDNSVSNFSSLCGVMNVEQVETVCKVCELVAEYDQYSPVLDWAEEKCPRTAKNQAWCGAFLLSGGNVSSQGSAVENNAPYGECRPVFFELIKKWSSLLMMSSIGVCIATIAVLVLTLVLRHKRAAIEEEDARHPSTSGYPRSNNNNNNSNHHYGNAHTQQQYGNQTQQYGGYHQQQQQYGNQHPQHFGNNNPRYERNNNNMQLDPYRNYSP